MTFTSEDIRYARNRLKVDLEGESKKGRNGMTYTTADINFAHKEFHVDLEAEDSRGPEPVEQINLGTEYEDPDGPAKGILRSLSWVIGATLIGGLIWGLFAMVVGR